MFKNVAKFEFVVAERVYHFFCDQDSPIDHVKDAIFQLQKAIFLIEQKAKEDQEKAKEAAEATEQPKEENGDQQ